ncbi:ribonuclease PH [Bacillus thuringiensis serovar brasilensis]|uniref:Ribonuclease PH n=1 Tax=Bacillus albus TaxID=2026189 RepID=A0ABN5U397_9BACI|nr:ribonuclease PH [Bacillus albus]OTX27032.1 ribonuclease PH [Bacillus thuringiensis serovar brasilensis]RXJ19044.1 ribonuclease PH [Bacillus albus]RXJ28402.1 ribonuclease PH [Bacillus albus]RXJ33351.1 ribonuclease PH [Bacillus albus]
MIIIDYHSTLIDKDYHCQYKPHTFSRKKQKALQKDPFFL